LESPASVNIEVEDLLLKSDCKSQSFAVTALTAVSSGESKPTNLTFKILSLSNSKVLKVSSQDAKKKIQAVKNPVATHFHAENMNESGHQAKKVSSKKLYECSKCD
jgi:hypothetical protein